jgi:outer membrane receptor protein involved in Fe transport
MVHAQSSGSVVGSVATDSIARPLEFVNVLVLRQLDSALVTGTTTDSDGRFEIAGLPPGRYFLDCNLVGYRATRAPRFAIDSTGPPVRVGVIPFVETAVGLDEVTVTSAPTTLTVGIDRKIYNVNQDVTSTTGSASDLLQNIPSVQVDIDGAVSLRGSGNVEILLNGKPSLLMGRNQAEALRQMPAATIEKIEVITNPSARFRPDGSSGIINIVMKRNADPGSSGSAGANIGTDDRYNGNLNLSYRPGVVGFTAAYGLRQDSRTGSGTDTRVETPPSGARGLYDDRSHSSARPFSHTASAGMEFRPDGANRAGVSGTYHYRRMTRDDFSRRIRSDEAGGLTGDYDRAGREESSEKEGGGGAFVQHSFGEEEHTLRLEFNAERQDESEDTRSTNTYHTPPGPTGYEHTARSDDDHQYRLTLDYVNPLAEGTTLETGYEAEFNRKAIGIAAETFDASAGQFVPDGGRSSVFIFRDALHAIYATCEHSFGPLGVLAGLRAEQALTTSRLVSRDSVIPNDYFNLYPTLHLSYALGPAWKLQLNYSRRANRPDADELNPFPEYQDPRNIRAGNPLLKPEFTHSLEFGFEVQNDYVTIVPALFYRNRYNAFTSVTRALDDTTLLTTQENLARGESAGLELVLSASVGRAFSTNLSMNAYYETIDASNLGFGDRKSTVTWSGNLNCNVTPFPATMVQLNAQYRSARLTPQGKHHPSLVVNAGIRQDLLDDRLTMMLTVSDIFRGLRRTIDLDTPWLRQTVEFRRDARVVFVGFTWHFGRQGRQRPDKDMQYENGM